MLRQNIGIVKKWFGIANAGIIPLIMMLVMLGTPALGAEFCGSLESNHGPFDYNDPERRGRLRLVEQYHLSDDVFMLRTHLTNITNNLNYTLNVFPNHPRALDAISRLAIREGTNQPGRARYSVDCFFERAIRWRPSDPTVRLVYAIHHYRFGRVDEAIAEAREGLKLAPNSAELHYNLGLFLVNKGDYAAARRHAQQAYRQNYPLPGLRQQLERVGQWSN